MLPPDWLAGQVADRGGQRGRAPDLQGRQPQRPGNGRLALRLRRVSATSWPSPAIIPPPASAACPSRCSTSTRSGLIALLRAMNEGLQVPGPPRQRRDPAQDRLLHRLRRLALQTARARADAAVLQAAAEDRRRRQWVIPQLGYDMRKFHEVKLLLASRGMGHVPDRRQRVSAQQGRGQAVPQRQAGRLRGQRRTAATCARSTPPGPTRGRSSSASWPPSSLAVFKGLGFAAGYLGGIAKAETLRRDHRPGRELRPRRLAGVHQGNPASRSRTSSSSSSTIRQTGLSEPDADQSGVSRSRWSSRRGRSR